MHAARLEAKIRISISPISYEKHCLIDETRRYGDFELNPRRNYAGEEERRTTNNTPMKMF